MSLNKKSLSQDMAAGIILLLIFTAVMFGFVGKIASSYNPQQKACQASINLRASLPATTKDFIPLRCKTEKYCIVGDSKGNCASSYGEAKDINKIRVSSITNIEKLLAEKMKTCYDVVGKGEINLFSQSVKTYYGLGDVYSSCIICSRIAFDLLSLARAGINPEDLQNIDLLAYLGTHKAKGVDVSYLAYFTANTGRVNIQSNKDIQTYAKQIENLIPQAEKELTTAPDKEKADIKAQINLGEEASRILKQNLGQQTIEKLENKIELALIFQQISAPSASSVYSNIFVTSVIGTGTALYQAPGTTIWAGKNLFKLAKAIWWGNIAGPMSGYGKVLGKFTGQGGLISLAVLIALFDMHYSSINSNQAIAARYCGEFGIGEEARFGCSAVKLVDYDLPGLEASCQIVEGI